jgi:hypothetical protein
MCLSLLQETTLTLFLSQNVIQVTVAGVLATWAYAKDEADRYCSNAVVDSLHRSLTYSFGSICCGSLFQGFAQILRFFVSIARIHPEERQNEHEGCESYVRCILDCVADGLERVIGSFNQYAFIYAGIYGTS